jgi:hypothetical protein
MKVKKFQEGGMAPAPAEQGAPQEAQMAQGQGDPQQQLMGLAQEIIQQMGPEAARMLAQIIMEMVQGGAQEAQPVFARRGAKIERIQ